MNCLMWTDVESLLQGPTVVAKLKSAYNVLIIGYRSLACETNLGYKWLVFFGVIGFDLGAFLHGQMMVSQS